MRNWELELQLLALNTSTLDTAPNLPIDILHHILIYTSINIYTYIPLKYWLQQTGRADDGWQI